jgi:hypothetical protein
MSIALNVIGSKMGKKEKPAMTNNPFDPGQFRLDNLTDPDVSAVPLLTSIPVRKPDRQQFVRVHPGDNYHYDTAILEYERESYLVAANMLGALQDEYRPVRLVLAMARGGMVPFLWPLKLPSSDGRTNTWNDSARMAAEAAKTAWVRVLPNHNLSLYETRTAEGIADDPVWPDEPIENILEIAFRGRTIMDEDHPIVAKLRGLQ